MWKFLISALDSHQFHFAFALQKKLCQDSFMQNNCETDQDEHKFELFIKVVTRTHSLISERHTVPFPWIKNVEAYCLVLCPFAASYTNFAWQSAWPWAPNCAAIVSDCPVTTQVLDCNIHLCLYCRLFWGWRNVGVVYHCRHNRRMFWSTIWKWVELINSLCNTLCSQPCLCILIPTLLNCLNQTGHTLCNKYKVINIHQSLKKTRSDWWGEKILNLLQN